MKFTLAFLMAGGALMMLPLSVQGATVAQLRYSCIREVMAGAWVVGYEDCVNMANTAASYGNRATGKDYYDAELYAGEGLMWAFAADMHIRNNGFTQTLCGQAKTFLERVYYGPYPDLTKLATMDLRRLSIYVNGWGQVCG